MGLLVLLGPTGTGKSALAVLLAERLGGEIVGCDAVQVYRGFDAATAKPSLEDRRRIAHHLVDVASPLHDFSLADYVRLAEEAIAGIARRGRVPLVVGGTGMYLRGLLRGIVPASPRDPELRERLTAIARRRGNARLHRLLGRLDPESARRLPPGDTQRIVRALEMALAGEETWSAALASRGTWTSGGDRYPSLKVGLDLDRPLLAGRLDARVDAFFEAGLVEEVRALLAGGVPPGANAWKAIGYREVEAAIAAGTDPAAARAEVQASTRRFAKRQRTWFRREPDVMWLDAAEGPEALAARVAALWEKRG